MSWSLPCDEEHDGHFFASFSDMNVTPHDVHFIFWIPCILAGSKCRYIKAVLSALFPLYGKQASPEE